MAVAATHLDFHTEGAKKSTGAKMRAHQDDQSGGTDSGDAQRAWQRGYGEELVIRDGHYWDKLVEDRSRGWFIELDVWYASLPDRAQASASFGHTIGLAPETHSTGKWLVGDPLREGWHWMDVADLRGAAEEWGRRILGGASGRTHGGPQIAEADIAEPVDTGGAVPIRYTTAVEETVVRVTDRKPVLLDVPTGVKLYDVNGIDDGAKVYTALTQTVSPFASRIGATVAARAVFANIGGVPQLRLVRTADTKNIKPIPVGDVDVDAILDKRDSEWVARLTPPRTV